MYKQRYEFETSEEYDEYLAELEDMYEDRYDDDVVMEGID